MAFPIEQPVTNAAVSPVPVTNGPPAAMSVPNSDHMSVERNSFASPPPRTGVVNNPYSSRTESSRTSSSQNSHSLSVGTFSARATASASSNPSSHGNTTANLPLPPVSPEEWVVPISFNDLFALVKRVRTTRSVFEESKPKTFLLVDIQQIGPKVGFRIEKNADYKTKSDSKVRTAADSVFCLLFQ